MIVWLNGTFGAGKTTTAGELVKLLPQSRIFDSEQVGYMLRHVLPDPPGDFQHLPPWRPLVCATAVQVLRHVGGTLVTPQTMFVEEYAREIFDGLAAEGVKVHHFVLHADESELVRRIEEDRSEHQSAREWRLHHLSAYQAALPWLRKSATVVDTTRKSPHEVALEVISVLKVTA
jgi:broad-specificity NMP kinase